MPVAVTVEPVISRTQRRQFADVPFLHHGKDERWAPPVRAFDQWRIDGRRHPFFDKGDGTFFLAKRGGVLVGRISAHVPTRRWGEDDDRVGYFGFFESTDDVAVAAPLVEVAARWLAEAGATSMVGPLSWTALDEWGVTVDGHDVPGATGRPWHPPHHARLLTNSGLRTVERRESHRLPVTEDRPGVVQVPPDSPAVAGKFSDDRLLLDDIVAVPDVADTLRSTSMRSAWATAKMAKARDWSTAVVVECTGDPAIAVPALQAAAGAAGYDDVLAPWAPKRGDRPETVHALLARDL